MAKFEYKIKDKVTGAFWNGDMRWSKFNTVGKSYKNMQAAEKAIAGFFRYGRRFEIENFEQVAAKWEIVEFEIKEVENKVHDISDYINYCTLKAELEGIDYSFANFVDTMRKRGCLDQIEYIFKLSKGKDRWRVSKEKVMEAREQLRQLQIKTRTFREYNGMFGMMNREQALRARLTLDVDKFVDLTELRKKIADKNS